MTELRQLNDVTIKVAYHLTNRQENLQNLRVQEIVTSIDACGAYHCIQIGERSSDCIAFINHFGEFVTYTCLSACLKLKVCIAQN